MGGSTGTNVYGALTFIAAMVENKQAGERAQHDL